MIASWPGSVRQLVNAIKQCVVLTSPPVISDALAEQASEDENTALPIFVEARNQFELNYLRKLLQITKGNVTYTARVTGRSRTEFYKLLPRHELDANGFKERIGVMCYVQQTKRRATFSRDSIKKIDVIIKPFKLDDAHEALAEAGTTGMTITEVKGSGRQKGHTRLHRGAEYMVDSLPKVRIEIVVPGDIVDICVDTIIRTAQTSKIGDGKIFAFDVTWVIRIRIGEEDDAAI